MGVAWVGYIVHRVRDAVIVDGLAEIRCDHMLGGQVHRTPIVGKRVGARACSTSVCTSVCAPVVDKGGHVVAVAHAIGRCVDQVTRKRLVG